MCKLVNAILLMGYEVSASTGLPTQKAIPHARRSLGSRLGDERSGFKVSHFSREAY